MSKRINKISYVILVLLLIIIVVIFSIKIYFKQQIRELSKESIFSKVVAKEIALESIITKYNGEDVNFYIHRNKESEGVIPYKKVNDETISALFKNFYLMGILYGKNGNVEFTIYPYIDLLWREGYTNGFYYSRKDEPIEVATGEKCGLEFETDNAQLYKWYRTEKIIDNWWYFERIISLK